LPEKDFFSLFIIDEAIEVSLRLTDAMMEKKSKPNEPKGAYD
jgi:hypothetical protein